MGSGALVTVLCAALTMAAGAAAQSPPLRIGENSFELQRVNGHLMVTSAALTALGGKIQTDGWRARLVLYGDTIRLASHTPFFSRGGSVFQLAAPPVRSGSGWLLPLQFFASWLPSNYPERIVINGRRLNAVTAPAERAAPKAAAPTVMPPRTVERPAPVPPRDSVRRVAPDPSLRARAARVVILDAGHGGRDPGKPGPGGVLEKSVALSVVNRLSGFLRERGYEVHLTRSTDTLISLDDRPHLGNGWKGARPAAVFVSLHANSGVAAARGFETYFLSEARTDDERRVAEMENASVKFEEKRGPRAPELDLIVSSLKNDFYLRASNDLAETIQGSLATVHSGPNRGVKRAGFRVLVGALMPAVLVEMAFISNPEEARLLGTSAFQQKIAWSLAAAIDRFFETHQQYFTPPQ